MIAVAMILMPDMNGLQLVFGVPAVIRLALLFQGIGIQEIHLVGSTDDIRTLGAETMPMVSVHPAEDQIGLDQVVAGLTLPQESWVLVVKGNQVIDQYSLRQLLGALRSHEGYAMAALGQEANEGVYVVRARRVPSLTRSLWNSCLLDHDTAGGIVRVPDVAGFPVTLTQDKSQIEHAEAQLVAALARQTATDDSLLSRRFDRRISSFLSKRVAHTGMSPNAITMANTLVGLTGAFFFSLPGYWPSIIGSLLFLACVIGDGIDGEVARLTLRESSFGRYLDIITDNLVHVAIFVGIALGLYNATQNSAYLVALWFLLGGFCLCALAVYQCILKPGYERLKAAPRLLRLLALMTNRDFAYLLVILAVIGRVKWFLLAASAGMYVFAALLWIMSGWQTRAQVE